MSDTAIVLLVLSAAAVLLITEAIPLAITAVTVPIVLALANVLTPAEAFASFSSSTIVLLAGTFVLSGAIFETGLAQRLGRLIIRTAGSSEPCLIATIMVTTALLSSVLSNTGTTAVLLPVVLTISAHSNTAKTRLLLPLAYGANIGGTLTLVGTTPNLIVLATLTHAGYEGFTFFEFAKIGVPLTLAGVGFMLLIGRRLLPLRSRSTPLMPEPPEETDKGNRSPRKMWVAGLILLATVIVMAGGWAPLSVVAAAGGALVVITRCISYEQAARSIDWTTLFLVAGMLTLAAALEKSGAVNLIADSTIGLLGDTASPFAIVGGVFALTWLLTQFMANTASSALLAPIGLSMAERLSANPKGILIAIAVAASCALATPVATPPNTLVYSAGPFRFMDFVRVGLPLSVVLLVICALLTPVLWPF